MEAVPVTGLSSGVAAVSAAGFHSCALKTNGEVWCWGNGMRGELANDFQDSSVPVRVNGLSPDIVATAGTLSFHCALSGSGSVWCWGHGYPIETNERGNGVAVPGPVEGLESGVIKVVGGYYHACVLLDSGTIRCWGVNEVGQLGVERTLFATEPVAMVGVPDGVVSLRYGCVLTYVGDTWCPNGETGAWELSDLPTSVRSYGTSAWLTLAGVVQRYEPFEYSYVESLLDGVTVLEGGGSHECALKSPGSVWCWGANSSGQLGLGPVGNQAYPGQITSLGTTVHGIAVGDDHSCAVTNAGGVFCWGYGFEGKLGNGSSSSSAVPVPVSGLGSGVRALSAAREHT
jgi:alpha-tubulin suppressor-like RCC1 family protein